jgi:hypothetical protein
MASNPQAEAEMRARQCHRGPVAGQKRGALISLAEYRTKIACFVKLDKGWSVARVAAHFQVNIDALQAWVDRGCPLKD